LQKVEHASRLFSQAISQQKQAQTIPYQTRHTKLTGKKTSYFFYRIHLVTDQRKLAKTLKRKQVKKLIV